MDYKSNIENINQQIKHYDAKKPLKLSYIWPLLFNHSDQLPYLVKQFWLKEFNDLGLFTTNQMLDTINQKITNAMQKYQYEQIEQLSQKARQIQFQTKQHQQTKYGLLYQKAMLEQSKPQYVTNQTFINTLKNLL